MAGDVPKATILTTRDARAWDSALSRFRYDFYHRRDYVAHCAAEEAGEGMAFFVETARGAVFLPLVLRQIARDGRVDGRDAFSPYGYPGPLVDALAEDMPDLLAAAAPLFATFGRELDLVSAFVRMHPLLTPNDAGWSSWGDVVQQGDTVKIDLTLGSAEWRRHVRQGHRTDIARAERNGFIVADDTDWCHLDGFVAAYHETMTRVGAAEQYFFPRNYFVWLHESLGETAKLLTVTRDGALAAAAIFVQTADIVQYHLAATRSDMIAEAPGKLLLHVAPGFFAARGATVLHLGGGVGSRNDGLFAFKRGFGTGTQPFSTLRTIFDAERYAGLCASPAAAANPTEGFFPAYRAPAFAS